MTVAKTKAAAIRPHDPNDGLLGPQVITGELAFLDHELSFEDWSIPYESITRAVLNMDRHMFAKMYTLLIQSRSGDYLFQLASDELWKKGVPFPYQRTETRKMVGLLERPLWVRWLMIIVGVMMAGRLLYGILFGFD